VQGIGEVGDGGRAAVGEHVQGRQLREPKAQVAQLAREPHDELPPERAAHGDPIGQLARVLEPVPGGRNGLRQAVTGGT